MFIDQAKISVKAGDGGNGCLSFRREKFIPKGGPDGGDGGNGGHIIFVADRHLLTLLDFKYLQHYKAEKGRHGQGANKTGKRGKDLIIKVPRGTLIKDAETDEIYGDLIDDQQQVMIARGGKGGRGNARFATPTNRTPREFETGVKGELHTLLLELKLIADIGLVGLPNVGKSTLLSRISAARPKIADYPFTTLQPNLGIVKYKDRYSYIVADIPGLIEGAHLGKGLGIQFIRHIERTRVLAFMIDCQSENFQTDIHILQNELRQYNVNLLKKPWFIIFTKIDLLTESELDKFSELTNQDFQWCMMSAVTGEGLEIVKDMMWNFLSKAM